MTHPEPKNALYILGAGFSAAAGLPLANDLWREVYRRALPMTGRAGQFREDLDAYIEFKEPPYGGGGAHNFRLVIIGYPLPPHDDYARQVIYGVVTNYQDIPAERVDYFKRQREPLIFVNLCKYVNNRAELLKRYGFIDWSKARIFLDRFNEAVIAAL
jgi:hypothetical protein